MRKLDFSNESINGLNQVVTIGPTGKNRAPAKQPEPAAEGRDPFPDRMAPQLATVKKAPPRGSGWLYEVMWDGYRMLAKLKAGQVCLYTRKGNNWTDKLPGLAAELAGKVALTSGKPRAAGHPYTVAPV